MALVRQIFPITRDLDPRTLYTDLDFSPPGDRPFLVLNFVTSVDGRVAVDGRASGLGSKVDRDVMRQLRGRADALLLGAGTLRAEAVDPRVPVEIAEERRARGQGAQPLLVLITASGDLPQRKLFQLRDVPRLILTIRTAPSAQLRGLDSHAEIHPIGDTSIDLAAAMGYLHGRGIGSVVCEGGPTLAGGLVARDLVDELFVTVAPRLVGGSGPRLLEGSLSGATGGAGLDLVTAFEEAGELFLRYRVVRGEQRP
jgi:2,5-diamino-6-(ribosylamino)-4(3H)-pyrimidinone 5'-phosphate reductase